MSKSTVSKASAILVSLSMLAITVYPVLAVDSTTGGIVKRQLPPISQRVETKKENIEMKIADMREKLASKAAALRLRLQTFKDKRKVDIAERVNTNLNMINQNQTAMMQKHLDKMSSILDRLETRINQGAPDIKDPAGAKAAVLAARATIASTSAAVSAQAQRDYTIQVTSEGRIGLDAKTQRDKLHTDLLALRKIVIDAKQAVANAIRIAKSGSKQKEGTTSGKQ